MVVEADEEDFSIHFVAEPFAFEKNQEVLLHFNGKREFMQQIVRIIDIVRPEEEADSALTFVIAPVGDPISAEIRESYRVSTISVALEARVGDETELEVQDRSATGFAVFASKGVQIRRTIESDPHTGVFLETPQRVFLAVQREQLERA